MNASCSSTTHRLPRPPDQRPPQRRQAAPVRAKRKRLYLSIRQLAIVIDPGNALRCERPRTVGPGDTTSPCPSSAPRFSGVRMSPRPRPMSSSMSAIATGTSAFPPERSHKDRSTWARRTPAVRLPPCDEQRWTCDHPRVSQRDLAHVLRSLWDRSGGKADVPVAIADIDDDIGRGRGDMRTPLNLGALRGTGPGGVAHRRCVGAHITGCCQDR